MSIELIAQRILWFLPMLLELGMATVMVRRRLHRELPLFFAFMLFDALWSAFGFAIRRHMPAYFYFYWTAEAVSAVLGFAVIYEIFANVMKRYEAIHRLGFWVYRWTALVLVVVATITAATAPTFDSSRIFEGIVTLERGVRIIQAGLLLVVFLFASYLGLSWRSNVFGIALGFGIYASIELALVAVRTHTGPAADQLYIWVKMSAQAFVTMVWAAYLLLPQPKPQIVTSLPKTEAARWNQALAEYLRR